MLFFIGPLNIAILFFYLCSSFSFSVGAFLKGTCQHNIDTHENYTFRIPCKQPVYARTHHYKTYTLVHARAHTYTRARSHTSDPGKIYK